MKDGSASYVYEHGAFTLKDSTGTRCAKADGVTRTALNP